MNHVFALVAALVFNATANVLMKMGMKSIAQAGGLTTDGCLGAARIILTTPILLVGLCCFGFSALLYMFALQSETLKISLAYPIMIGGGFVIIAMVAAVAPSLRERLTAGQWVGVAFILIGVVTIAALTPSQTAS